MNKELEFLTNLFNAEAQSINVFIFLFQILICAILCLAIAFFYTKFGNSLSNRRALAKNFLLIGVTTMIIITIVKSSLQLSLGLVGALSIVRFRTAIKDPEELAYFFIVIAAGLGIGAGQILVTIVGVLTLCLLVFIVNKQQKKDLLQNLIISFARNEKAEESELISILEKHSSQLSLRRMDSGKERSEITFSASFSGHKQLLEAKKAVETQFPDATISFLEL
jgi:uncharacterized membrane protein YhiD involved in acid resistance